MPRRGRGMARLCLTSCGDCPGALLPRIIPANKMDTAPPNGVLIIGCGDVGRRLAAVYRAEGREVAGVVRSAESAAALAAAGVRAIRCELDGDDLPSLPSRRAALFYL